MAILKSISNYASETLQGISGAILRTQEQATRTYQNPPLQDWRVRLALADEFDCLYNDPNPESILKPLQETDGVIFPYTPSINISYSANYESLDPAHSNYRIHQYRNSAIDQVMISCDFTAQDTYEANYMLAVIHFFRSITKMFYGQDEFPRLGTPPPLCFLHGMGAYQFDQHPLVITNFVYNLPNDVDYIRAGITARDVGTGIYTTDPLENKESPNAIQRLGTLIRLAGQIRPGGLPAPTVFSPPAPGAGEGTYVPTKLSVQISALPIISRNQISNQFSLKDYASGKLLRGSKNSSGGGIW